MAETHTFKAWALSQGFVQKAHLDTLRGTTIGIDAEDYLYTLLAEQPTREPLLPAIGGAPFALLQHVDRDLDELASAGIKAIFVFNGLELGCKDRKNISRECQKASLLLDEAWKIYDEGHGDPAVALFGKTCVYRTSHITRYLYFYLHRKGQQVMVAPYNAAAQMVTLEQNQYVNALHGSASTLVFGVDRVITKFDWNDRKIQFVDREQILSKLGMNQQQLVDLLLLSGTSIIATMPEVDAENAVPKIQTAKNLLSRAGNDGHAACALAKDEDYLDTFRRARVAVKHMVVAQPSGEIVQLDHENAPSNDHECIGQRLPEELLAYHQFGLIGSRILNWRTRQEIFETPPLDGGDSATYKELLREKLQPRRAKALAILTSTLHRYYQKHDVDLICWFNEAEKRPLGIPDSNVSTRDIDNWHVKEAQILASPYAKSIDATATPLQYAVALISDDAFAKSTVTPRPTGDDKKLDTPLELLCNTMWRFLQERGYINSNHTLAARGRMLQAAFEHASTSGRLGKGNSANEMEEAIFIAFELLTMDLLNPKLLFPRPPYSGEPHRGSENDKANVRLITRVACLGSFQHQAIGYTGPLSRHLLAYHQVASAVRGSLRDLAEVHGAHMFLSGSAVRIRDRADFTDLGARLPFSKEPDVGLAIVLKSYLDEMSNDQSRRADIKKWFGFAIDIDGDLQKALDLWAAVNAGIQAADTAVVSPETRDLFANADHWLKEKTKNVGHVNGTA